jgi:large subunit ribosomal protein L29
MKASEYRDLSIEELAVKEKELSEALFNLKFQHATGQLDNTAQLKKTRKDIARVRTILVEKRGAEKD